MFVGMAVLKPVDVECNSESLCAGPSIYLFLPLPDTHALVGR
jgi:hypothetical protein